MVQMALASSTVCLALPWLFVQPLKAPITREAIGEVLTLATLEGTVSSV